LRVFIAVFPPSEVIREISELVERARRPGDGISWVKPDNLHYTLRFLGELEGTRLEAARWAAGEAVRGMPAFGATLGASGAFPNFRRPRVLWMGLEAGAEELELLARSLEVALRRAGFGRADRAFAAHLTLGRVRELGSAKGAQAAEHLASERLHGSFRVERLTVVRSQLSPKGSIYTPLVECPLEGI
jgi:2'-5' RNA ligase